jgi:hypothetical protein
MAAVARIGHMPRRWPKLKAIKRTVSFTISDEDYKKLENIRDNSNNDILDTPEDFCSVSSLAQHAMEDFLLEYDCMTVEPNELTKQTQSKGE